MNKTERCMRCMREKEEGRFCSECGYDNESKNPERALPVGTILNGKYLVGVVIGEGGFGITYAAWDLLIETAVAIKEYFPSEMVTRDTTLQEGHSATNLTLISEENGEQRYREGIKRFVQEAENLAKFQRQPGVVSVKDFFYENNTAYMVMEYIRGITLKSYLENHRGRLGVEETLRMMEPVMKTLEVIHKEGIVHRDISPDNIMVTEDGQMKLIDFGAARFVGAEDEKSLTVILKHGYAPEEQYRSDGKQGPWTDVYALSAVIYRMLTGKVPEETVQRMAEKQDSIHKELAKVPGLPAKVRAGIEKGLALKAGKRYQTIGALYDGIYSGKKWDIRKWAVAMGVMAAAVLCVAIVGTGRMREDAEESFAEEDDTTEEAYDEEIVFEEETDEPNGEEEMAEEEELEEPENIRALREYYNANCLGKRGKVYFVDLTGDEEDEMIVLETDNLAECVELWGTLKLSLAVYQCADGIVREIYRADADKEMSGEMVSATEINYYLFMQDGKAGILSEHCADMMTEVSFKNDEEDFIELITIPQEEFRERRRHSILLLDSFTMMTPAGNVKEELEDYQSVLNCKEEMADVIRIAETSEETVLDYSIVYDGSDKCIFAVTGKIQSDQTNGDDSPMEYYEGLLSLWASCGGQIRKIDEIDDESISYAGYWMGSEIYQFGKSQHYFLLFGTGGAHYIAYVQLKFCFEDGNVYELNGPDLEKDENGKVQMKFSHNVEELNGNYLIDSYGAEIYEQDAIDIFFYDQQYVEYGTEIVDNDILEEYENYNEIIQVIEETVANRSYIGGAPAYLYGHMDYYVMETEMDHIRKSVNNVYYINYKVYGRRMGWYSTDFFDQYSEECDVWAYAVVEATGNQLEFRRIVFGKRGEYSDIGLPIYYGPDRELKSASKE